jgi:hypothetical protein
MLYVGWGDSRVCFLSFDPVRAMGTEALSILSQRLPQKEFASDTGGRDDRWISSKTSPLAVEQKAVGDTALGGGQLLGYGA